MEVGNIMDLQVSINHAIFWVLPHSSGAYLVEAVRCLCQDTVTQLFLRIPVFQTAYGISAQGCIQNLVGADHATCIRSEEHTSELQSPCNLVCRLLLEKTIKLYCHRSSHHVIVSLVSLVPDLRKRMGKIVF